MSRTGPKLKTMILRALLLAAGLMSLGAGSARAADSLSVGLYLAENINPPPNALVAPGKLHARLRDVFGFEHYELLKADTINLRHTWEQWFLPRKDFFLRVQPLPEEDDGTRQIDYEIYKDGFIVAKGRYEPDEDTPLFVAGPSFRQGRLLFVLEAR